MDKNDFSQKQVFYPSLIQNQFRDYHDLLTIHDFEGTAHSINTSNIGVSWSDASVFSKRTGNPSDPVS